MSNRIRITVNVDVCSVLECDDNSVDPADFADADLDARDLALAICDTIRNRATRARQHRAPPQREVAEASGRDYGRDGPD
jgi:hypothetical protein